MGRFRLLVSHKNAMNGYIVLYFWQKEIMYQRLLKINPNLQSSVFLFGPRGTGKTSWLKTHLENIVYYDLLDYEVYTRLLAWPKRIAEDIPEHFKGWIIIDEIQKAPLSFDNNLKNKRKALTHGIIYAIRANKFFITIGYKIDA